MKTQQFLTNVMQRGKVQLSFPHVFIGMPAAQRMLWQAGNPE